MGSGWIPLISILKSALTYKVLSAYKIFSGAFVPASPINPGSEPLQLHDLLSFWDPIYLSFIYIFFSLIEQTMQLDIYNLLK
jgi:hypothetical protein